MTTPRQRVATVWVRKGRHIVDRVDITTDGVPIGVDDLVVFDGEVTDHALGEALITIISRARRGIRHPGSQAEWTARARPLLAAAGVSTWRSFVRGAREVSVFADPQTVELWPSINFGVTDGFGGPADGIELVPRDGPPAALGAAVNECWRGHEPRLRVRAEVAAPQGLRANRRRSAR